MVHAAPDHPIRVLHLEDSAEDHFLATRVLQRSALDVEMQQVDTLEAFRLCISTTDFDLILADYRLPGFTALDAWAEICRRPHHPPFVLLSGAIGETAAVDAIRLGVSDYVLKDEISRLPHVIKRALEIHRARLDKERAILELQESQARLAELTEHLQTSIEQERAAIAREIHDDIGGALTAVRFDMAWIKRHAPQEDVQRRAQTAEDMLQHATEASQRIMMNLRPPVLEEGLVAAIEWLAENFERRTGVPSTLTSSAATIEVPPAVQLAAYRTAQEALTNVSKYAQASKVTIDLSDHDQVLTLEIQDNGKGIAPEMLNKPKSFGLKGLQERARAIGGWLDISSRPNHGTSIILSVPLTTTLSSTTKEAPT